jgi:hypothetical protein
VKIVKRYWKQKYKNRRKKKGSQNERKLFIFPKCCFFLIIYVNDEVCYSTNFIPFKPKNDGLLFIKLGKTSNI